ncbi:hypothetical protein [Actinophytocola sp.]|uniref:hypothetical protein n=1 Tax=Actinophytocola sp. TaxID=1872138 RepID=UPI002D80D708|nr:hypothetical protein [Actinophytocola sp.]HET9137914.1 hypothetical protein [Actinophytocola sp.]
MAATLEHILGLGSASASQNTDARPVTLRTSLSTLRTVDEAPYRTAILAGAKLVTLSWAVYPTLDATRPAGLSTRSSGRNSVSATVSPASPSPASCC